MGLIGDMSRGAVAGTIGTAAMTVSEEAEMRVTGRDASMVPGVVASKLLPLNPKGKKELARVSWGVHWAHGIAQGKIRGLLGHLGVKGVAPGAAVHFGVMWTGDVLLYKALGVAPWPWEWTRAELATDVLHKGFYAVVTSVAYERLAR